MRAAPGVASAALVRLFLDIADQDVLGRRIGHQLRRYRQLGWQARDRLARDRVHGDLPAIGAQRREHQPVVGQHRLHDLRETIEDVAHVETAGHHQEERVDGVEPAPALGVEMKEPRVFESQA